MSGSGSSGGGGAVGGGGVPPVAVVDCTQIMEKTVLNSPVPDVLRTLKKGDVLKVMLHERSLVAAKENNEIAGALTPPLLPRIVECINEGYEYIAIVDAILEGKCTVEIRLRSRV